MSSCGRHAGWGDCRWALKIIPFRNLSFASKKLILFVTGDPVGLEVTGVEVTGEFDGPLVEGWPVGAQVTGPDVNGDIVGWDDVGFDVG